MTDIELLVTTDPNAFMDRAADEAGLPSKTSYGIEDIDEVTIDGVTFKFELVHSEGGGEGEGEYVERVYRVSSPNLVEVFLRDQGFYESYNGTEMNGDFRVVYPHTVTVIRYAEAGKQAHV